MSENVPAGHFLAKRWFETPNKQALVIAAIFAISAVTFYILFDAASKIEYFKEILAALMGTLLTAVITTVLLNSQTNSQEIKERNAEVFKRKFDAYSAFIRLASLHTADRVLSKKEATQLLSMFHRIRLLGDKETAESVFLFIENNFLKEDRPAFSMDYVLIVLKNDLFSTRESVEEKDLVDTSSFVKLINTDQEIVSRHKEVVRSILEKIFRGLDRSEPNVVETVFEPSYHSDYAELSFVTSQGLTFHLQITYEIIDDPDSFPAFSGVVEIDSRLKKQAVIDAAKLTGFSYDEREDNVAFVVDIKTRKKSYVCEGDTIWSVRHFCDCAIELERKLRGSPDRMAS